MNHLKIVSTHFSLSSFLLSSYVSNLIYPLYERHCLVHSFPFFNQQLWFR